MSWNTEKILFFMNKNLNMNVKENFFNILYHYDNVLYFQLSLSLIMNNEDKSYYNLLYEKFNNNQKEVCVVLTKKNNLSGYQEELLIDGFKIHNFIKLYNFNKIKTKELTYKEVEYLEDMTYLTNIL